MERGDVRDCQGTALVVWAALTSDRQERVGTNVLVFDADGRVESIIGFGRMSPRS